MPECPGPLWPCALTGAAACVSGLEGLTVVIHGSSGCYYYPATLLHSPLHCTFLIESDLVMGGEERLLEVVRAIPRTGNRQIAVLLSCVPSLSGEDARAVLAEYDPVIVESPGFMGGAEEGYRLALESLKPVIDPSRDAVNIDGVNLLDPFSSGNVHEMQRLLSLVGAEQGTIFCLDRLEQVYSAAPFTLGTNPDFASGVGKEFGAPLGLDATSRVFSDLCDHIDGISIAPLEKDIRKAEERLVRACDKYLQRYDPPRVVIFGTSAYAAFAAESLGRYLDAEIAAIGTRNEPAIGCLPAEKVTGFSRAREIIEEQAPDLIMGSSFERMLAPDAAFVGLTPPLRGQVRLHANPICGPEGMLSFMDAVLNASIDHVRHT